MQTRRTRRTTFTVAAIGAILVATTPAIAKQAPPLRKLHERSLNDADRLKVGFCVKVGRRDLKITEAVIVAPSGSAAWDAQMKSEVIGMKVPTPVAWTSDFWEWLGVGQPGEERPPNARERERARRIQQIDCSAFNKRLCGLSNCRQAKAANPATSPRPAGHPSVSATR